MRKRDRDRAEALRLAGGPPPSLRDRAVARALERGEVRTRDLTDAGIPRCYPSRMCEEGLLAKFGQGRYRAVIPKAARIVALWPTADGPLCRRQPREADLRRASAFRHSTQRAGTNKRGGAENPHLAEIAGERIREAEARRRVRDVRISHFLTLAHAFAERDGTS